MSKQYKRSIGITFFVIFFVSQADVSIPVSYGELIDKITILEIKKKKIYNTEKLHHISKELELLESVQKTITALQSKELLMLKKKLKAINRIMWVVEDLVRECECNKNFDNYFTILARLVYILNDLRAATKRKICLLSNSTLLEEKQYTSY